jgi:hypothetical protein
MADLSRGRLLGNMAIHGPCVSPSWGGPITPTRPRPCLQSCYVTKRLPEVERGLRGPPPRDAYWAVLQTQP